MVVTLLRHGLTEPNKRRAYVGASDPPLCLEDKTEIERLRNSLTERTEVFSSDLTRCLETAKLLFPAHDLIEMPEFREIHFGVWEGKTYEDLKDDHDYQSWLQQPFSQQPPGGESFSIFSERIEMGWKKLRKEAVSVRNITVVTHGGVIRYLLTVLAPEPKQFWEWEVPHATGYELIWTGKKWRNGERCTLLRAVPTMEKQNG